MASEHAILVEGSSASSSKEEEEEQVIEEQTTKFCLSQSESESKSEQEDNAKITKKATAKKSKKLKRKVNEDLEDSKRKKKQQKHCNPEKRALFKKFWSQEDEIALLKGIKNFAKLEIPSGKNKSDLFFDYIKDDIHFDVSKKQLNDKVSKLKKKFEKNMKGNRCTFAPSHTQKVFNLSRLIWNVKVNGSNEVIARELKVSDRNDNDEVIAKKLKVLESYFGTDGKETEMKQLFILGLNSFEGSKKKEMIQEYWQWFICQMDLIGKQNDIIRKQYNSIMSIYKTY